jgi:predicted enzyme related to lactoylglutathione lyase
MAHVSSWFEIPVADVERATRCHGQVLGVAIEPMSVSPVMMGMLSSDPNARGGAIVHAADAAPSQSGTNAHLDGGDDLAPMLVRVEASNGSMVVPKTGIGNGFGYFAHSVDTGPNTVGLHAMQ